MRWKSTDVYSSAPDQLALADIDQHSYNNVSPPFRLVRDHLRCTSLQILHYGSLFQSGVVVGVSKYGPMRSHQHILFKQGYRYKLWSVNSPERYAESGRQRTTEPTINKGSHSSIKVLEILHGQYSDGLAQTQWRKVKQPSRPDTRGNGINQEQYNSINIRTGEYYITMAGVQSGLPGSDTGHVWTLL